MHFTPSFGNTCTVFKGDRTFKRATLFSAQTLSYTSGYDVAPGGYFNTQGVLNEEGNGSIAGKYLWDFQANFYSVLPNHSFINTKSALAFSGSNKNLSENISNRNLVCTGETPFDSYFGQFNKNSEHVELWPEATTWITKEIDGIQQQPSVNYVITCPDAMCGTKTYQVDNLPANITVTWSVSGHLTISGSATANPVTVTGNGTGTATINATVSCGNVMVSKTVNVGPGAAPGPIGGFLNSSGGYITANITSVPGATSYKWYLNNTFLVSGPSTTISIPIRTNGCGYSYYVSVEAISACGTSGRSSRVFNEPFCGQSYTIYPNPANDQLTIEYKDVSSDGVTETTSPMKKDFEVKILDEKGKVKKAGKNLNRSKTVVLDTREIANGTYFLHIYEGNEVIKKQVIIQH